MTVISSSPASVPNLLSYDQPTSEYISGLPVGNGRVGAILYGSPTEGKIGLNHSWLWRGTSIGWKLPQTADKLPEIRKLFFEGKTKEAGELANAQLGVREHTGVSPYQPLGTVTLRLSGQEKFAQYHRDLDLSTGVTRVRYRVGDGNYLWELFTPRDRDEVLLHISCDRPGRLNGDVVLGRIPDNECRLEAVTTNGSAELRGRFPEVLSFDAEGKPVLTMEKLEGIGVPAEAVYHLKNRTEVFLRLKCACTGRRVARALQSDTPSEDKILFTFSINITEIKDAGEFELLRSAHIRKHAALFNRVRLSLGTGPSTSKPIDQRLTAMRSGMSDSDLERLYFQYGRYLLISSNAPSGLPANLQGIWNDQLRPPWDADYHLDINLQMNYWPAQAANLAECEEPFFDYVDRLSKNGLAASTAFYGTEGTYIPITSDAWGICLKTQGEWSEWTGAAAWLAQHYWRRWEYSGDREFLASRAYPFLKNVAHFYQSYLVPDPRPDSRWKGKLVPVPSYSPENTFVGGSPSVSLSIGATMELELIHESLTHAVAASEILGKDEAERALWKEILTKLPPLQVGKYGQLQEWLDDYEEAEPGHRHFSPLYALFPGDQITIEATPELAKAAQITIKRRLEHEGGHTGWSRSWLVGLYARLRDPEQAEFHLRHLIADFSTISLLDLHPPRVFQIDGNFGGTAGMCEMLLQSHNGIIRLLPALPTSWPDGEVSGLKARGNIEVGLSWKSGRAIQATLRSINAQRVKIKLPAGVKVKSITAGRQNIVVPLPDSHGVMTLQLPARRTARLVLQGK